jgi:hypothetical protein
MINVHLIPFVDLAGSHHGTSGLVSLYDPILKLHVIAVVHAPNLTRGTMGARVADLTPFRIVVTPTAFTALATLATG